MHDPEIEIADLGSLTRREAEAVLWVARGKTSWEAGQILGVSEHTLSTHVARACEKLSASNRAHLVARAFVVGVLVVAARRVSVVLFAAICALGADGAIMRRAPRPPRCGREKTEAVAGGSI